jgi:thiol-disulfide isomerase/thioredoxin
MLLEALLLVSAFGQTLLTGPKPSLQEAMRFMASIKDDVSIDLTDDTFEHETQAATGATTGDWFVFFYNPSCQKCAFFAPEWKFLAERVRDQQVQVNIAKIDVIANPKIARRLRIYSTPTYLYFKSGNYYNFTGYPTANTFDGMVKNQEFLQYPKSPVPAEISYMMDWYLFLRWWVIELKVEIIGILGLALFGLYVNKKIREIPENERNKETEKPKRD